ncbi:MAG: acyltransferase family protein [Ketobacter sp.]|nr:acyltransferase family protein [Ketobacter sp.]
MKARIEFLDNLRFSLILSVVAVHAALAYSRVVPYWPISDVDETVVYDVLIFVRDLFGMPLLFMISGYFAWMSLMKEADRPVRFLMKKLYRIGVPFLVSLVCLAPAVSYMYRYKGNALAQEIPATFSEHWQLFGHSILSLSTRILGQGAVTDVVLGHLWFISTLLVFYVVLVVGFSVSGHRLRTAAFWLRDLSFGKSFLLLLVLFPALVGGALNAVGLIFYGGIAESVWVVVYSVFSIQLVRIGTYAGAFMFGAYLCANHTHLFDREAVRSISLKRWFGCAVAALIGVVLMYGVYAAGYFEMNAVAVAGMGVFSVCRNLLGAALMMVCLLLAFRHWRTSGPLSRRLSGASFDIYLLHMPFVVWMQLLMMSFDVVSSVKFVAVWLVSVVACFYISETLMRRSMLWRAGCLASPGVVSWLVFH